MVCIYFLFILSGLFVVGLYPINIIKQLLFSQDFHAFVLKSKFEGISSSQNTEMHVNENASPDMAI